MPVTDTQLNLIFRYFDGDLSAKEEEQLMQELQQNVELQQAFDQQILMQQFEPDDEINPVISTATESADDFLKRVTGSMETKQKPVNARPVPMIKKNYAWMAAAAVLVCVLAITLYYFNRKNTINPVVKLPGKDSIAQIKQREQKQLQIDTTLTHTENLQQLYADNYEVFSGNELNVPPAAMMYELEYKQGNYEKLAKESESILGTKGTGDPAEELEIADYFYFYKALANIQIGDTTTAEKLLRKLLNGSAGKTKLGNPSQWYLLMVYLKSNNKQKALLVAKSIVNNKSSIYQKRGIYMQEKLNK